MQHTTTSTSTQTLNNEVGQLVQGGQNNVRLEGTFDVLNEYLKTRSQGTVLECLFSWILNIHEIIYDS